MTESAGRQDERGTRSFDRVVLIFNPQSTGDAKQKAEKLRDTLAERVPGLPVELQPTERAGHARSLARDAAAKGGAPLIVSVSGDGGYSEVVDGLMQSGNGDVVAAVLAAGNANDHRRATRERPLAESIAEGGPVARMDLLKLTSGTDVQWAHSYIGLGLTPVVAIDLEKGSKGSLREIVSVVRTFARFRPFALDLADGGRVRLDSLVFANIDQMAKYATLSTDGDPDDGVFEVVTIPHASKWKVLLTALRAATRGLGEQPSVRSYRFRTVDPTPLQVDGEVIEVAAGTDVSVDLDRAALTELR